MSQGQENKDAMKDQSQDEGQAKKAVTAEEPGENEEVRAYGEPTDGSGGSGDQVSTVP